MNFAGEPSFRDSVDLMFNRATALMDLSPGLEQKIKVCNSTYTVRFGVRLRGKIETFTGYRSVRSADQKAGCASIPVPGSRMNSNRSPAVSPMS